MTLPDELSPKTTTTATDAVSEYDERSIRVLEGVEGIRHRPAMYIGSVNSRGLHHMVYEIVDNSVDEALAGYCTECKVIINSDNSITVVDNGRGIPAAYHPKYKKSTLEVILTKIHSGGKFDNKAYKVSGGLHGVGLAVVNALSSQFIVEVVRDGKLYRQEYSRGKKVTEVEELPIPPGRSRGTTITFKPDPEVFETTVFDFDIIAARLRELAYLTPSLRFELIDERTDPPTVVEYHYEGGIIQFVRDLNAHKTPLIDGDEFIFYVKGSEEIVIVEVALTWNAGFAETIMGFVNNINTTEGGTHISGFKSSLTRTLNDFARAHKLLKDKDPNLKGEFFREGLVAIVSVKVPDPQFEGQTKTRLGNSEVEGIVSRVFGDAFEEWLEKNISFGKAVIAKSLNAKKAQDAARKARDLIRKSGNRVTLPGKLIVSRETDPEKRELFLVEGQSAGGTAVKARDSQFQEILFLRGKVLNVEKAGLSRALDNQEIRSIISAIGTGINDDFDISKCRYGKIIILTDADVDGAHITTLLLTLFYRYMRPLIEQGKVFVARPPLFRVTVKGTIPQEIMQGRRYAYLRSEKEKDELVSRLREAGVSSKNIEIQRYKGLGEMNADQLEETAMRPGSRVIERLQIVDEVQTDEIFSILMGDDVTERKKFIVTQVFSEDETGGTGYFWDLASEMDQEPEAAIEDVLSEEEEAEPTVGQEAVIPTDHEL